MNHDIDNLLALNGLIQAGHNIWTFNDMWDNTFIQGLVVLVIAAEVVCIGVYVHDYFNEFIGVLLFVLVSIISYFLYRYYESQSNIERLYCTKKIKPREYDQQCRSCTKAGTEKLLRSQ